MTPEQKIYNIAVAHLGQHLTLDNAVPSTEGCAEAVSVILLKAGYPIPQGGIPTVNGLIAWMLNHGFVECGPEVGSVITAHQPNYYDGNWAHTGIRLKTGIASNNSFGGQYGLFTQNYTLDQWEQFFEEQHGSVTRHFKPIR